MSSDRIQSVQSLMSAILGDHLLSSDEYQAQLERFIEQSGKSKTVLEQTQVQLDLLREMNGTPEANMQEILPLLQANLERIQELSEKVTQDCLDASGASNAAGLP